MTSLAIAPVSRWLLVAGFFMAVGIVAAHADTRVMIVFDDSGHRVERVVGDVTTSSRQRLTASRIQTRNRGNQLAGGMSMVYWFDAGANLLYSERIRDPRVRHAPHRTSSGSDDGSAERIVYVVQTHGVYLLSAAYGATVAKVHLPELSVGGRSLPAERWTLDVTADAGR